MEQGQTPKQVQPEDTETIQIEERDAKREFNSGGRGMDAMCTISIPHVEAWISRVLATLTINKRH